MEHRNISVKETCRISGLGRTSVNQLIRENKIVSKKFGKRRLVSLKSVLEILCADNDIE